MSNSDLPPWPPLQEISVPGYGIVPVTYKGHGSFGVVYRCEIQGEPFAFKQVDMLRMHGHGGGVQAAMREVEILEKCSKCQHGEEYNVGLRDYFLQSHGGEHVTDWVNAQWLFLRTPWAPHGSLLDVLKAQPDQKFSEQAGCGLLQQKLLGLRYLHSNGICHRDLKVENILVYSLTPLKIKLTDYGIAKNEIAVCPAMSKLGNKITAPEIFKDTHRPFRFKGGHCYDESADIWNTGATLFLLITGFRPFLDQYDRQWRADYPSASSYFMCYDDMIGSPPYACNSFWCKHQCFLGLSQSVQSLVASMMFPTPIGRPTLLAVMQHPWTQMSKEQLQMNPPVNVRPLCLRMTHVEVPVFCVRISKKEIMHRPLGGTEMLQAQVSFKGDGGVAEYHLAQLTEFLASLCLDVGRRHQVQVCAVRKSGARGVIWEPQPSTTVSFGDDVWFGGSEEKIQQFVQAVTETGTESAVTPFHLCCGEIEVPCFMDDCVLGGSACANHLGQGHLNYRPNLRLTVAGLQRAANPESPIFFPGGRQSVLAGDRLLLPLALKGPSGLQHNFNIVDKSEHESFFDFKTFLQLELQGKVARSRSSVAVLAHDEFIPKSPPNELVVPPPVLNLPTTDDMLPRSPPRPPSL